MSLHKVLSPFVNQKGQRITGDEYSPANKQEMETLLAKRCISAETVKAKPPAKKATTKSGTAKKAAETVKAEATGEGNSE